METKNMEFWNKVCKTNPAETKTVEYPFKHTAIGAMFQIKHATEQWGIFGDNWGVKDEKFTPIMINTDERGFLVYSAILFYPSDGRECETPIHADITFYNKTKNGFKIENDITKKVATDALTKGLSKLGFNADVFEGLFDDNKYVQQMIKEFSGQKDHGNQKAILEAIGKKSTIKELDSVIQKRTDYSWTESELKEQNDLIEKIRAFITEAK
jgi:hypothetical protein